jgi:hypothetical protein
MPRTLVSGLEKDEILRELEQRVGLTHKATRRRPDWRLSRDRKLSVFVTYSTLHRGCKTWYDVSADDLRQWLQYPRAFVIFVLEHHTRRLILPLSLLETRVRHVKLADDGNFKLHISESRGKYLFNECPLVDLTPYYNKFDLLPA